MAARKYLARNWAVKETGAKKYSDKIFLNQDGPPEITDVNTTESWNDGDTGLVITGINFV